jgi:hypothetical protein
MRLYQFHATVHARPASLSTASHPLRGSTYKTLVVSAEAMAAPFSISFEAAGEALSKLERMFFEPDGSFVWVSSSTSPSPWQVDGVLYDRQEKLLFVDLKGSCTESDFNRLLSAFGWPNTPLMFQMVREAVFLDEAEFRRASAAPDGS